MGRGQYTMKTLLNHLNCSHNRLSRSQRGGARLVVLALSFFVLGAVLSALWFLRVAQRDTTAQPVPGPALSSSTLTILNGLESPVEIRYYALLDPKTVSELLPPFADRVDRLLWMFERESGGKLKLTRQNKPSDSASRAAAADGIEAFNLDKGDACFLGLAVVCGDQKESLAKLSPDWEPALESDLSRAIARVASAKPPSKVVSSAAPLDPDAAKEVRSAIPDLESVSVLEAAQRLREAALKEFQTATAEMDKLVKEAQRRVSEAERAGSELERQAALKHLQAVQAEQAHKLQRIAAQLQAQITALEQMKR